MFRDILKLSGQWENTYLVKHLLMTTSTCSWFINLRDHLRMQLGRGGSFKVCTDAKILSLFMFLAACLSYGVLYYL